MSEVSGEFLSGDAMLTHAIKQHQAMVELLEATLRVVSQNARAMHMGHHLNIVSAKTWEECGMTTCREVRELKRKVEAACGVKVPVAV